VTNPYEPPAHDQAPIEEGQLPDGQRSRHGCVTAYLAFMLLMNSVSALVTVVTSDQITSTLPDMPSWGIPTLVVASALNVVFTVLLFSWKKIGFFGFIATSIVAAVVNAMAGLEPVQIIGGLIGVGVLYGVLQIGKPPAWKQLD
jgi:hypothetical protein